uniref:DDE Tnp4 domain-containing protein n=1 Tax=Sphaeramia orbicularis TaxID=375764 RepID=A0A672ZYV1_9TELE
MHNCAHMAAVVVSRRRRRYDERRLLTTAPPCRPEETLIKRYRLSSFAILELLDEIRADLEPATRRSQAIPAMTNLLTSLHFFASGSFQRTVAITAGISQSRFSDVLSEVVNAMLHRMLVPPVDTEHVYRNRKHTHSLNVQCVCDAKGIITNAVAKYPGSVHDSYILRNSALFSKLQDGEFEDGWLVSDSTYPLHPFPLTPVLNPTTAAENRYEAHIHTRNSRFHCLDRTGGALLYRPEKVAQIVVTCCMLHNIAKLHGLEHDGMLEENADLSLRMEQQPNAAGTQTCTSLIQSHFLGVWGMHLFFYCHLMICNAEKHLD